MPPNAYYNLLSLQISCWLCPCLFTVLRYEVSKHYKPNCLKRTQLNRTHMPKVRQRCDVSKALSCGDGPRHSINTSAQYREYNKDLIFYYNKKFIGGEYNEKLKRGGVIPRIPSGSVKVFCFLFNQPKFCGYCQVQQEQGYQNFSILPNVG